MITFGCVYIFVCSPFSTFDGIITRKRVVLVIDSPRSVKCETKMKMKIYEKSSSICSLHLLAAYLLVAVAWLGTAVVSAAKSKNVDAFSGRL